MTTAHRLILFRTHGHFNSKLLSNRSTKLCKRSFTILPKVIVSTACNNTTNTKDEAHYFVNHWKILAGMSVIGGTFLVDTQLKNSNINTNCSAETSSRNDVNVTDVEADLIARSLREMIDIPGIPNAIEKPLVEQIIKAFIKKCPLLLPEGVFNKLVAGEAGIEGLEESIIREINDEIYIPLVSREVQNHIVETICKVFFTSASLAGVRRQMVARSLRAVVNDESRVNLATELNSVVDIPLLSETQEQHVAEKFVEMCFTLLETFIPAPIREILDSTAPEELRDIRNNMVDRLNEKIELPWTSEEDEKKAFRFVVDFFLSFYGLHEGTKNPEEVLSDVKHELEVCKILLEAHRESSYDKEQKLLVKIADLKKKQKETYRELNKTTSWTGFFKFWKKN